MFKTIIFVGAVVIGVLLGVHYAKSDEVINPDQQQECLSPSIFKGNLVSEGKANGVVVKLDRVFDKPEDIKALTQLFIDSGATNIVDFDRFEVYTSDANSNLVFLVAYNKGCKVRAFPAPMDMWLGDLKSHGLELQNS